MEQGYELIIFKHDLCIYLIWFKVDQIESLYLLCHGVPIGYNNVWWQKFLVLRYVLQDILYFMDTKLMISTTFHPFINGQLKVINRTSLHPLLKFNIKHPCAWYESLPSIYTKSPTQLDFHSQLGNQISISTVVQCWWCFNAKRHLLCCQACKDYLKHNGKYMKSLSTVCPSINITIPNIEFHTS